MNALSGSARIAAGMIAALAWVGLAVQFDASLGLTGTVGATLWVMLRYFTVIANLLAALIFSGVALGKRAAAAPRAIGGVTLVMLLVGVVFAVLLNGLLELSGGAAIADLLLHKVTPVLIALYWLALAPKGGLTKSDPLIWALLPSGYFIYALARGLNDGHYAYPFMDLAHLGWARTIGNALLMAVSFLLGGFILVGLDRLFASRNAVLK